MRCDQGLGDEMKKAYVQRKGVAMQNLKERYATATRAAKEATKKGKAEQRSTEEERVFNAFRKQAKAAYSTLRPATTGRTAS